MISSLSQEKKALFSLLLRTFVSAGREHLSIQRMLERNSLSRIFGRGFRG